MIEIKNITKVFAGKQKAVDNISLDIPDGKIVGFIGPNGAGKTTTIKMITGVLKPESGDIIVNNFDITKQPFEAKQEFGIVWDSADNFLRMKGIEYINFLADIYNVDKQTRTERISELAEKFGMQGALNDKISSYSHGMRQKIAIIGVLVHEPNIWILDEPMTGLDPQSSLILKDMMKAHAEKGKSVFFSTHVLEVAERLCDEIAIINHGAIAFYGTLHELQARYPHIDTLENLFMEVIGNA